MQDVLKRTLSYKGYIVMIAFFRMQTRCRLMFAKIVIRRERVQEIVT